MADTAQLYTVFHLNLFFSSLEETERATVVQRCYWPLLGLLDAAGVPLGIELTGSTLEQIASIDPAWVERFRTELDRGRAELIGSGYVQLISPLVPAEVTEQNLKLGEECYGRLLGVSPKIALVNEQAFSSGLVRLYRDAGYDGLVMDWAESASYHPEWPMTVTQRPQTVAGEDGSTLGILWTHTIAFQKLQRFAHGQLELEEYLDYVRRNLRRGYRSLCVYGNDAEVFAFRPKRFHYEQDPRTDEWDRVAVALRALDDMEEVAFRLPGDVLSEAAPSSAPLHLDSAACPIPVKKQPKYNVTRWGLSGRDDLVINTACYRILDGIRESGGGSDDWATLCAHWRSDYRTHITDARWSSFLPRLREALSRWAAPRPPVPRPSGPSPTAFDIARQGRHLEVSGPSCRVRLNLQRGLAIDRVELPGERASWFGTLEHGFFDDVAYGADFYSGHLVVESGATAKATDLSDADPEIGGGPDGSVVVTAVVGTSLGDLRKTFVFYPDVPRFGLCFEADWLWTACGVVRLAYVTLNPECFDRSTLFYATHSGGHGAIRFPVGERAFDHGRAVSSLVSARNACGMTEDVFELGDARRRILVRCERVDAALLPLVTFDEVRESYFFRVAFSAQETDDTSRERSPSVSRVACPIARLSFELLEPS